MHIRAMRLLVRVFEPLVCSLSIENRLGNLAPGRLASNKQVAHQAVIEPNAVPPGRGAVGVIEQLVEAGDLRWSQSLVIHQCRLDNTKHCAAEN